MSIRNEWNNKEPKIKKDLVNGKEVSDNIDDEICKDTTVSRKETKRKICLKYFKEFTSNTSLHGLQYIGEDGRPMTERVWWAIMFTLSLATCIFLILQVWIKWQHIPVIVSFADTSTPVWQITFPAVTICAETKSLQTIFNYTEVFHKIQDGVELTETERKYFMTVSLLCDENDSDENESEATDKNIIGCMKDVAPALKDTFLVCRWKSNNIPCSEIFTQIITEEGVCYTFNMLDADEMFKKEAIHKDYKFVDHGNISTGWNLHNGYPKDLPVDTYPIRGPGSGASTGLTIVLKSNIDDLDYLCKGPTQGYKISLHTPAEVPKVTQNYVSIPHNQNVMIAMKPNMMTASEGLIDYDPAKRNCFYPYERKLKYFKQYTRDNCILECLSNYTAHVCGCTTFFMPRDPGVPLCTIDKYSCYSGMQDELLTRDIRKGLKTRQVHVETLEERNTRKAKNKIASLCVCLPGCTSISYEVESSQSNFHWREFFAALKTERNTSTALEEASPYALQRIAFFEKNNIPYDNVTSRKAERLQLSGVSIFFKEPEFLMSIRSELYGRTDFLANCGGLLGLCLGFSVLSLIEIIYFLTLRAACNLKRRFSRKTIANEAEQPSSAFN